MNNSTPIEDKRNETGANNGQKMGFLICHYCGKPGHYARNCFVNPGRVGSFGGSQIGLQNVARTHTLSDTDFQEFLKFKQDREKREKAEEQAILIEMALKKAGLVVLNQPQVQVQQPLVQAQPTQNLPVEVSEVSTPASPTRIKKEAYSVPNKKRKTIDFEEDKGTKKMKMEKINIYDTGNDLLDEIIGVVCDDGNKEDVGAIILGAKEKDQITLYGAIKLWLGVGVPKDEKTIARYPAKVYNAAYNKINSEDYSSLFFQQV